MKAQGFLFESDFVESLRCIPMSVRLKLDLAGVKLKLSEWSRLGRIERSALLSGPCASPEEIETWKGLVSVLVESACGASPTLMPPADPVWEAARDTPDQVKEKAASLGLALESDDWKSLSPLQRFALIKLSRPGHENMNFAPACREFGLS